MEVLTARVLQVFNMKFLSQSFALTSLVLSTLLIFASILTNLAIIFRHPATVVSHEPLGGKSRFLVSACSRNGVARCLALSVGGRPHARHSRRRLPRQ